MLDKVQCDSTSLMSTIQIYENVVQKDFKGEDCNIMIQLKILNTFQPLNTDIIVVHGVKFFYFSNFSYVYFIIIPAANTKSLPSGRSEMVMYGSYHINVITPQSIINR